MFSFQLTLKIQFIPVSALQCNAMSVESFSKETAKVTFVNTSV